MITEATEKMPVETIGYCYFVCGWREKIGIQKSTVNTLSFLFHYFHCEEKRALFRIICFFSNKDQTQSLKFVVFVPIRKNTKTL